MWAAVGGAAVGGAASLIGGGKSSKSAAKAQSAAADAQMKQALQNQAFQKENQNWANQANIANAGTAQGMTRENLGWANEQNRGNQEWAQGLNQAAIDQQTGANRLDSTNAFGNSVKFGDDGTVTQSLGAQDQGLMNNYYDKANSIMGGMGEGFNVNGDVMNAYRGVNQPLVDEQRGKENARLAAMGLGTGSGSAWGSAQDALNRNQVNSDQNAILQGFNADQALRTSNRADLGALGGVRTGVQSGLAQPDYAKQGSYAGVQSPTVSGWQSQIASLGAANAPQGLDANAALNYGQGAGQATQNSWNTLGKGAGDATSSLLKKYLSQDGNTATTYGTTPGSQQTQMLAAQDAGMGGKNTW